MLEPVIAIASFVLEGLATFGINKTISSGLKKRKEGRALAKAINAAIDQVKKRYPSFADIFDNDLIQRAIGNEVLKLFIHGKMGSQAIVAQVHKEFPNSKPDVGRAVVFLCETLKDKFYGDDVLRELAVSGDVRSVSERLKRVYEEVVPRDLSECYSQVKEDVVKYFEKEQQSLVGGLKEIVEMPLQFRVVKSDSSLLSGGKKKGDLVSLNYLDVIEWASLGRRIYLVGTPGAGKTTALRLIAKRALQKFDDFLPVYVSVPHLVMAGADISQHVCNRAPYNTLKATEFEAFAREGNVIFLIDGWNELSGEKVEEACRKIEDMLERYPKSSFVLASRESAALPALGEEYRVEICPLSRETRRILLEKSCEDPVPVLDGIERVPQLDELSRNPLFLSLLLQIKEGGDAPTTKESVINQSVTIYEEEQTRKRLLHAAPLFGFHGQYLSALGYKMLSAGTTGIPTPEALKIVSSTGRSLLEKGLIGTSPEPIQVIQALRDQHLLVQEDNI